MYICQTNKNGNKEAPVSSSSIVGITENYPYLKSQEFIYFKS